MVDFRLKGFTLVEVVVAIGIFSLIGLGCYQLANGIIGASKRISVSEDSYREIVRLNSILDQDFRHISPRRIKNQNGVLLAAITTEKDVLSDDAIIEFSRSGFRNPALSKRGEIIRVAYGIEKANSDFQPSNINENGGSNSKLSEKNYLVRYIWPVLDRAGDAAPTRQIVLRNIHSLEFEFMDNDGNWIDSWPPNTSLSTEKNDIPCSIRIRLILENEVDLVRTYSTKQLKAGKQS